ncbi:hypothetical protein ACF08N_27805 [Streptomyces sp. NPDC015127]
MSVLAGPSGQLRAHSRLVLGGLALEWLGLAPAGFAPVVADGTLLVPL